MRKMRRGGAMAPMNPVDYPFPLPENNPGLDAAFIASQSPLNRALGASGGKKYKRSKKNGGGKMISLMPGSIPPYSHPNANSQNMWLAENGAVAYGNSPGNAQANAMATGNHPATKSMYQSRWTPFIQ